MSTIVQTETSRLHPTNDENFEVAAALTGGRDLQPAPAKTAVTRDRHGDIKAELRLLLGQHRAVAAASSSSPA